METREEIRKELHALNSDATKARFDFYSRAVNLADAVVRNREAVCKIDGEIAELIRAFLEADEQYDKAVGEAVECAGRLAECAPEDHQWGAEEASTPRSRQNCQHFTPLRYFQGDQGAAGARGTALVGVPGAGEGSSGAKGPHRGE